MVANILYTFISNVCLDLCLYKPNTSTTFTTIINHIRHYKWPENKNYTGIIINS